MMSLAAPRHHCVAPYGVPNGWMTSFPAGYFARNPASAKPLPAQSLLETAVSPLQCSLHEPAPSHSATTRLNLEHCSTDAAPDSSPATRQRVAEHLGRFAPGLLVQILTGSAPECLAIGVTSYVPDVQCCVLQPCGIEGSETTEMLRSRDERIAVGGQV